jgi:hypothetical protein
MEKHIMRWSYWLGIACLAIAIAWKGVNAFGMLLPAKTASQYAIWYMSFFRGSLLFFVTSIASANYSLINSHKA